MSTPPENTPFPAGVWGKRATLLGFKTIADLPGQFGGALPHAVGQSHLDAAWRWRAAQTHDKARETFRNNIRHLRQHPAFTFSQSQPVYYQWIRDEHPHLFAAIRDAVQEGRWELVGGLWVEPDANLPGGEALVRQRFYGQRFYLEHFGKLSETEWLPDTFGFCWTLPQIFKKSGARFFWTTKLLWNDTSRFPLRAFHWEGPDGSRVLTHISPLHPLMGALAGHNQPRPIRLLKEGTALTADYRTTKNAIREHLSEDELPVALMAYGYGDGGAGPLPWEVDAVQTLAREGVCTQGTAMEVLEKIEQHAHRLPVWNDELYLEYHRGCYTTHANLKQANRRLEHLLTDTETLCALAALEGAAHPAAALETAWKGLLFNQFHDILPGSGIVEVCEDALADYAAVEETALEQREGAFAALAPAAGDQPSLVLANTLSFPRREVVLVDNGSLPPGPVQARQSLTLDGKRFTAVATGALPPFSITTCTLADAAAEASGHPVLLEQTGTAVVMDNGVIRAELDGRTGWPCSLRHLASGHETLGGPAGQFLLYRDDPKLFPAWNIDPKYRERPLPYETSPTSVEVLAQGPLTAMVRVTHQLAKTFVRQTYRLDAGSPLLSVLFQTEWKQKKTLLKVAFPFAGAAEQVTAEIPYGVIDRPLFPQTLAEKARWEMPCQRWFGVSDGQKGLTVLNDGRYGFSTAGQQMRLTLLRSARYPTPWLGAKNLKPRNQRAKFTDLCPHETRYALLPHPGDWRTAKAWQHAMAFNTPLFPQAVQTDCAAQQQWLSFTAGSTAITACKTPEDGGQRQLIVRLVEMEGAADTVTLSSARDGFVLTAAQETDLLELNPQPVGTLADGTLTVPLSPHEIKTLSLTF